MKTLQGVKDEYAQEQGYEDFIELKLGNDCAWLMESHTDEICLRAQKEALENAAKNAKTKKTGNSGSYFDASVDRTSITNERNLIR